MQCRLPIDAEDFMRIASSLQEHGWLGVQAQISERIREIAESAGMQISHPGGFTQGYVVDSIGVAEVFLKDGDVYYFQFVPEDLPRVTVDDSDDLSFVLSSIRSRSRIQRKVVEIGIVTQQDSLVVEKLGRLATDVEAATGSAIDGRKARHFNFSWQSKFTIRRRIELLKSRFSEDGIELSIVTPEISEEKTEAAENLAVEVNRRVLLDLKSAGFAREADVLAKRAAKQQGEVRKALETLKSTGLIQVQFLLQCRQTSSIIIRMDSLEELEQPHVAGLKCGNCNRVFRDELATEGYTVSSLGKELSNSSHWMTLWVTDRLMKAGVPADSIVWNLEESGEEVDIMVDFMGELWLIELKDREFGAGDAHPFNYRTVRYHSNRAFIISTDRVSGDAKKVFTELGRSARPRRNKQSSQQPIYVEGLDKVMDVFGAEVQRVSSQLANSYLQVPQLLTGYRLTSLLS
jgi:hypothetical protein